MLRDVSENKLTELNPEIGDLQCLTRLDLHTNNLVTVPPEIGKLSRLQHLSLHLNLLEGLPPEIGGWVAGCRDTQGISRFFFGPTTIFLIFQTTKIGDVSPL